MTSSHPFAAPQSASTPPAGLGARECDGAREHDDLPVFEASPEVLAMDSITTRLADIEHEIRRLEARRVEILAEAFDLAALASRRIVGGQDLPVDSSVPEGSEAELKYRAIRAELAAALHLGEATIERRMVRAWELTHCYGSVFAAYSDAEVSEQHVNVILDAGRIVGLQSDVDTVFRRAEYAAQTLAHAVRMSPNRLRPLARQIAEQYAEAPLDDRHLTARRKRRVWIAEAEHGMADLFAHLPADEAYAIHDRLVRMGRVVAEGEQRDREARTGSPACAAPGARTRELGARSRDEIRADLFSDLLLHGGTEACRTAGIAGIRGQVQLLVPGAAMLTALETSLDATRDGVLHENTARAPRAICTDLGRPTAPLPATMHGYGPIDTATALRIAGGAEAWETIRTDPVSHEVLAVDRYRPSEQMRRFLRARDQHCRFPGCRAPLSRCDIDHTIDAAHGGRTATDNLAHLCRGHHTLKHHGGWSVEQRDRGLLEWRSPTGRRYREPAPSTVRFAVSATGPPDFAHPF